MSLKPGPGPTPGPSVGELTAAYRAGILTPAGTAREVANRICAAPR